jgi:hypothetical protein
MRFGNRDEKKTGSWIFHLCGSVKLYCCGDLARSDTVFNDSAESVTRCTAGA